MTKFDPIGSCYPNGFSTTEKDPLTGTAVKVHRALGAKTSRVRRMIVR